MQSKITLPTKTPSLETKDPRILEGPKPDDIQWNMILL